MTRAIDGRGEERGLATIVTISFLSGLVVGGIALAITTSTVFAQRITKQQLEMVQGIGIEQRVLSPLLLQLLERLAGQTLTDPPLILEELQHPNDPAQSLLTVWRNRLVAMNQPEGITVDTGKVVVEDELAKLSIVTQSYAVPFVLKHLWGGSAAYPSDEDVNALGSYLGYLPTRTPPQPDAPRGFLYWWRPDILLTPRVQPLNQVPSAYRGPAERGVAWVWDPPHQNLPCLEHIDQLANVWPERNLEELKKYFTILPSRGVNVNMVANPEGKGHLVLQGLLDFQLAASAAHPKLREVYQAKNLAPASVLPDPDEPLTTARFRGVRVPLNQAKAVVETSAADTRLGRWNKYANEKRAYRSRDLIQHLMTWPVVWPLSEQFQWGIPMRRSMTLHLQGPGPYLDRSDTYTLRWAAAYHGVAYQGRVTVRTRDGAPPMIMNREIVY